MAKVDGDLVASRMALGRLLEAARKKAGYPTRYGFAAACSLNDQKIAVVETGRQCYTIDTLSRYLDGLDLDLQKVFGGDALVSGVAGPVQAPVVPVAKKPVGRPAKEKPVRRVPVLDWAQYEDGLAAHPRLDQKVLEEAGIAGLGGLLIAPEKAWAKWTVYFVIVLETFEWLIINHGAGWVLKRGDALSVEEAKAAIDGERRSYDGIFDGYDFSEEDGL